MDLVETLLAVGYWLLVKSQELKSPKPRAKNQKLKTKS